MCPSCELALPYPDETHQFRLVSLKIWGSEFSKCGEVALGEELKVWVRFRPLVAVSGNDSIVARLQTRLATTGNSR